MVEPGRRMLGDRYQLSALIASGGMGQVWRGTDVLLHRPVAVKVLRSEYTGDPTFLARFRAEAQHAAALSHPNIAAVFDYGETEAADTGEQLAYLVMELVEGQPLSALLRTEGRLDTSTTLSVLSQTAAALAEAHRAGLVHRDVKPGNILVRPDGSVKITDFGIAWSAGSVPLTRTGQVIGTPQYLSPEQAEGHLATPASDVYALGLVGYECLTGHPAFDGDNAVTIALKQLRQDPEPLSDDLPGGVRTLIRRALSKDPAARMPDGAAFVAAVEDARAGRLPADPPPAPATPARAVVDTGPATQAAPLPAGVPGPHAEGSAPHRNGPPAAPRRRAAAVLVPLLALLLGAGLAGAAFAALSEGAEAPTVVAAQTRDGEDDGVELAAEDYLGRPVEDVAAQLSALALSVQRREQVTGDSVPGLVVDVTPTGRLQPGDEVVVTSSVAPPSRETGDGDGGVSGDRGSVSPVTGASVPEQVAGPAPTVPETAAASSAPPAPATSSAPTPDASPPGATRTPADTSTSSEPTSPATETASTSTPTTSAGPSASPSVTDTSTPSAPAGRWPTAGAYPSS
ncbi:serine/threonine-protein kinase [Geodermatophilus sp. URMC 62]|uniref:serine/threonine-protein kinase n=1 Tax=Geodermatophilus sp. URMC 62 TaxID=3423414 RepID=UPI00406CC61E